MRPFAHAGRVVEAQHRTDAAAERVWQAWTDPAAISGWYCNAARGAFELGGRVVWQFERFGLHLEAEVLAVEPNARFVLGPAHDAPPMLLEVRIADEGERRRVEVLQSGFLESHEHDEAFEGCRSGWQIALAMLSHYCERHFGRARTEVLSLHAADYGYGQLKHFFRTGTGLSQWLTRAGIIGPAGSAYEIELRDGGKLSGRVLRVSSRGEMLLSANEIDGMIELKGFQMGPAPRQVGIRAHGYDLPPGRAAELEALFDRAVERLAAALEKP